MRARLLPRAPTEEQILRALRLMGSAATAPTHLALAARLWPEEDVLDLVLAPWHFAHTPLPVAPVVWLRRRLRSLCTLGHVLLTPCQAGIHCHGTGKRRCPLGLVERAPWPRSAQGPIWQRVKLEAPGGALVLDVLEPHPDETVARGRLYVDRCPAGVVLLHGAGEGIDPEFQQVPSCSSYLRPSDRELHRLAERVEAELTSRPPPIVLDVLRPQPPSAVPGTERCRHG